MSANEGPITIRELCSSCNDANLNCFASVFSKIINSDLRYSCFESSSMELTYICIMITWRQWQIVKSIAGLNSTSPRLSRV